MQIRVRTQQWVLVHEKDALPSDAPDINFVSWHAANVEGCRELFGSPSYTFFEKDFYDRLRRFRNQLRVIHGLDFVVWAGHMSPQQRALISRIYENKLPDQKVAPPGDPCVSLHTFAAAANMMFMPKGGDPKLFMKLIQRGDIDNIERHNNNKGRLALFVDPIIPDTLCETARITLHREKIMSCARANGLETDKNFEWHVRKAGDPPPYTVVTEYPSRQVCCMNKSGTIYPVGVTEHSPT